MVAVVGKLSFNYRDYDGESSGVLVKVNTPSSGNFAAQLTAVMALNTAIDGITLGLLQAYDWSWRYENSGQPAATPQAQRELKWLVKYKDNATERVFQVEIPCADRTLLDPNARKVADMSNAAVVAFVTAFEAVVLSPDNGGVTVISIELVGRNL